MPLQIQTFQRNIILDPISVNKIYETPLKELTFEQVSEENKELIGFRGDFVRPLPNDDFHFQDEDFRWLSLGFLSELQWDFSSCVDSNGVSILKELMQKAFTSTLKEEE